MANKPLLWIFFLLYLLLGPRCSTVAASSDSAGGEDTDDLEVLGEEPSSSVRSTQSPFHEDELLPFETTTSLKLLIDNQEEVLEGSGEPLTIATIQRNQVSLRKTQALGQHQEPSESTEEKDDVQTQEPIPEVQLPLQKSEVVPAPSLNAQIQIPQELVTSLEPVKSTVTLVHAPEVIIPEEPEETESPLEPLDIPPMKLRKLSRTPPSSTCSAFAKYSKMLLYLVCDGADTAFAHADDPSNGFSVYETLPGSPSARSKRETTRNIPTSGEVGNELLRVRTKAAVKSLKPFIADSGLFIIAIMETGYSYVYAIEINKDQTAGKARIVYRIPHQFLTDVTVVYVGHGKEEKIYLAFSIYTDNCKPHQKKCHGGSPVYQFVKGTLSLCDYVGVQRAVTVRGWEESGVAVLTYVSDVDDDATNSFLSFFEIDDGVECEVVPSRSQPHIHEIKGKSLCGIRAVEPFWRNRETYLAVGISTANTPFSCPPGGIEKSFVLSPHENETDMFSTEKLTYFPGEAKIFGFNLVDTPCTRLIETYGALSSTEFHKAEVRNEHLVITTVPGLRDVPDNILDSAVNNQKDRTYISFSRPDSHDLPVLELSCDEEDKSKKVPKNVAKSRPKIPVNRARYHNLTVFKNQDVFEHDRDSKKIYHARPKPTVEEDHHPAFSNYKFHKQKFNASFDELTKKQEKNTDHERGIKPSRPALKHVESNRLPPPKLGPHREDPPTAPHAHPPMIKFPPARLPQNMSAHRFAPPPAQHLIPGNHRARNQSSHPAPSRQERPPPLPHMRDFPPPPFRTIRDLPPPPPPPVDDFFATGQMDQPSDSFSFVNMTHGLDDRPQSTVLQEPLPPVPDFPPSLVDGSLAPGQMVLASNTSLFVNMTQRPDDRPQSTVLREAASPVPDFPPPPVDNFFSPGRMVPAGNTSRFVNMARRPDDRPQSTVIRGQEPTPLSPDFPPPPPPPLDNIFFPPGQMVLVSNTSSFGSTTQGSGERPRYPLLLKSLPPGQMVPPSIGSRFVNTNQKPAEQPRSPLFQESLPPANDQRSPPPADFAVSKTDIALPDFQFPSNHTFNQVQEVVYPIQELPPLDRVSPQSPSQKPPSQNPPPSRNPPPSQNPSSNHNPPASHSPSPSPNPPPNQNPPHSQNPQPDQNPPASHNPPPSPNSPPRQNPEPNQNPQPDQNSPPSQNPQPNQNPPPSQNPQPSQNRQPNQNSPPSQNPTSQNSPHSQNPSSSQKSPPVQQLSAPAQNMSYLNTIIHIDQTFNQPPPMNEVRFLDQAFNQSGPSTSPEQEVQPPRDPELQPPNQASFYEKAPVQPIPSSEERSVEQSFVRPSPMQPPPGSRPMLFHNPPMGQQRPPPQPWPQQPFQETSFFHPNIPGFSVGSPQQGPAQLAYGKPVGSSKRRLKADRAN